MWFEYPALLACLIALIPALWLMFRGRRRALTIAGIYRGQAPGKVFFRLRLLSVCLFIASLTILSARPYVRIVEAGDFVFLVDTSRSMDARNTCGDLTYLDRAKNVMRDVINGVPEARFGIIIFDRFTFPITQMTHDRVYLDQVIEDGLHVGMTFEATRTELANALTVTAMKKARLPGIYGNIRQVILLSDGNVGGDFHRRMADPLTQLRDLGVEIHAVGIGNSSETPIMASERGQCLNQPVEMDEKVVLITLRDDVLKFISAESRGQYYSEGDTGRLIQTLRENLVSREQDDAEGSEAIGTGSYRRDISWIFLLTATLGLFSWMLLESGLRRPGIGRLLRSRR